MGFLHLNEAATLFTQTQISENEENNFTLMLHTFILA